MSTLNKKMCLGLSQINSSLSAILNKRFAPREIWSLSALDRAYDLDLCWYLINYCTYMVDTLWLMFVLWYCTLQSNWLLVEWGLMWCCLLTYHWINCIIKVYPIYTLNMTLSLSYLTPIRHWSLTSSKENNLVF